MLTKSRPKETISHVQSQSRWNLIPQEPDPDKFSTKGIIVPPILNFKENRDIDENRVKVQKHVQDCIDLAIQLSNLDADPLKEHLLGSTTVHRTVRSKEKNFTLDICIDCFRVAGVKDSNLLGVRHSTSVPLPASFVIDAINRLNYTNLVDPYSYLVEKVENIETNYQLAWSHVAYTADKLFFLLNHRDFCTFDFVSEPHMMTFSRSCRHYKRPSYSPQANLHSCCPTLNHVFARGTYRVPLYFFQRVIPDELNTQKCRLVQFQYSDVGGFITPQDQTRAVIQFELRNIPKVIRALCDAIHDGLPLGPDTDGYMKDPLTPR